MILTNWSLISLNPNAAPELVAVCLHGNVHGHTLFEDGEEITTSRIVRIDVEGDEIMVTTRNNVYMLGVVDPAYEKAYPGAVQRLKAQAANGGKDQEQPVFQIKAKENFTELWLMFNNGAISLNNIANRREGLVSKLLTQAIQEELARLKKEAGL